MRHGIGPSRNIDRCVPFAESTAVGNEASKGRVNRDRRGAAFLCERHRAGFG
jgi:hypothetical protein